MRARPLAKFRHNSAITIAAVIAIIGTIPFAAARWWLAPVVLIPIAIALWSWRTGVDVDGAGLRVRSVFASRRVPWADVEGFTGGDGRVEAVLRSGRVVPLPAVAPGDVRRLLAAAGQPLGVEPDTGTAEPAGTPPAGDEPSAHETDDAAATARAAAGHDRAPESAGSPPDSGPTSGSRPGQ